MRDVGIIGGGIGGVAAAAALRKLGIPATVYERAPRLEEVGAGMMLWPNATRVLESLGLLDDVAARSASTTHFLVRASRGQVLMNIALGKFDVRRCARGDRICSRRCFPHCRASASAWAGNSRIWSKSRSKVRVHFADGCVGEHDAVIGADGIRSRVRAQLFGFPIRFTAATPCGEESPPTAAGDAPRI